ncbi:Major facilitator:Oxalate:Formate Antiporter [Anaerovibrio sp. JC8]|uniref:MFS transporter n=1 Tax=Anaerovibrio sp. JC8 TaxID=1240085 RepID=UPI000A0C4B29|nr:MFS transporter [Anaerovibrio sp. JC8]ORU00633.1 Major facilitator:Oxalate:Formate Antiporter [Anaerovibrio sp. JC8]
MYLFYGVIGRIGLGVGYITPVSTLVKYFPNHRDFATGLAIMGFGFAALIAGPVMQSLTATYGLINNFIIMGVIYMLVMGASALYLKPPAASNESAAKAIYHGFTAGEAIKTWQFGALWWIFFVNITCGIGLLAVASPMAQQIVGMDACLSVRYLWYPGTKCHSWSNFNSLGASRCSRPYHRFLLLGTNPQLYLHHVLFRRLLCAKFYYCNYFKAIWHEKPCSCYGRKIILTKD